MRFLRLSCTCVERHYDDDNHALLLYSNMCVPLWRVGVGADAAFCKQGKTAGPFLTERHTKRMGGDDIQRSENSRAKSAIRVFVVVVAKQQSNYCYKRYITIN